MPSLRLRGVNPLAVLRFARTHPRPMIDYGSRAGREANTLAMLITFARMDARHPDQAGAIDVLDRSLLFAAPHAVMTSRIPLREIPADELTHIKAELLASIDRFVDGGRIHWSAGLPQPIPIDRLEVWRLPQRGLRHELHGPWPLHFWSAVAGLIEASGDLLRRCPRCALAFVQSGRSRYCTRACSARARAAKNYRKHRVRILAQRRGRYERAVTARQPHAKIQRRPRTKGPHR